MRRRAMLVVSALGVGGGLAGALAACVSVRAPGPPTSAPAPDFTLRSHRDRQVSLRGLTGDGPAVLVFYRGYW